VLQRAGWALPRPFFVFTSFHNKKQLRPSFSPKKIPGTHFCFKLSRPQGYSAVGRIKSIEKSSDLIGNRTRDFPVCSIGRYRERLISCQYVERGLISAGARGGSAVQ
jgi:hypothetical protein